MMTKLAIKLIAYKFLGPNELSFFDPAAVSVILGPKCSKGPFYDITLPLVSMQTTRDKQLHAERRRIWDKGINVKGIFHENPNKFSFADYQKHFGCTRKGYSKYQKPW